MPVTLSTVKTGFWIAMADLAGAKTGQEMQLTPAPTRVEYPNATLGELIETADGRVVMQASSKDPRRRTWVWSNYGPDVTVYERQYRWLHQLTARTRLTLGLSPYVYVFDGTTNLLNTYRSHTTAVTSMAGAVLTIPALPGTIALANLKNATIDVLSGGNSSNPYERRSVMSATSTTLTLDQPLASAPGTSQIALSWSEPAWWKARVLDTTRELRDDGGRPRYTSTRFMFVVDEEMSL